MSARVGYLPKAVAVVVITTLVGAWPAYAIGGVDGVVGLALAGLVSLAGALLGHLPRLFLRSGPDAVMHAALAGLGVRLLATIAMAAALLLLAPYPRAAMAIGLVLSYLSLLVLEVRDLLERVRRLEAAPPPESRSLASGTDGASTR